MDMKDLSLHGIIGGGGSNIKSIQRGEVLLNLASTITNVNIAAVDLTKSIVRYTISSTGLTLAESEVLAQITTSTNLKLERNTNNASYAPTISWEVIEFQNIKSLQNGTTTIANGTNEINVTVSTINLNKCLLFSSYKTNNAIAYTQVATVLNQRNMKNKITTATNINFKTASTDGSQIIYWYLIEFN